MKNLAALLASTFLLSACAFVPPPPGSVPQHDASEPAPLPSNASPVVLEEPVDPAEAPEEPAVASEAPELDTAALCTKAATCTTRVSMELCGLLDPECLDAFHKHADGATREKCQEKLDRLPGLVERHKKGSYVLPPECR